MNFQKDFNTLFNEILTDWQNQFPDADLSKGSLIYMKSACLASALWGLYKYQDWIAKQIFADTADTACLEKHGWTRGISRNIGESDADYLARILEYIRRPPAGGNQYDYVKWAKAINGVGKAWCISIMDGPGTVCVLILADPATTGSEVPSCSSRLGITEAYGQNKLIDNDSMDFTAGDPVTPGDIVENPIRGTKTTVLSVDSPIQLTLADDIFPFLNDTYIIYCQTGVNTDIAANKLMDGNANFQDPNYTIAPGDIVQNLIDNTQTTVVSVDSSEQVTLADDIFTAVGQSYVFRGVVEQTQASIEQLQPVGGVQTYVWWPEFIMQDVSMIVYGSPNKQTILTNVTAYLNSMLPGQTLYIAKLVQIAMDAGATNVEFTNMNGDITVDPYSMIRAGVISVA